MEKLEWRLEAGEGRTRVKLTGGRMGKGLVLFLFNEAAHIGAVAVSEFDHKENRASTSVISLLGHKDDALAYKAAHEVCRALKAPTSVLAGVHLDDIKLPEIKAIEANAGKAVAKFLDQYPK